MDSFLYKKAKEYINFAIAGKTLNVPYVTNDGSCYCSPRSLGKGTVEEIRNELTQKTLEKKISLESSPSHKIKELMKEWGIGIDCSGFVYHLLDALLQKKKGIKLDNVILRYGGIIGVIERSILKAKRVRRISATTLVSDLNTVVVREVSKIQEGGLISLTHGARKHVAIIVKVEQTKIIYAHSTGTTVETSGTHFGEIEIVDRNQGLDKQRWLELTKEGLNYGKECFRVEKGDCVRRLRYL